MSVQHIKASELFPDIDAMFVEPTVFVSGHRHGLISTRAQQLFLMYLAKITSDVIVEFGTFIGNTTWYMAVNSKAHIYTIDSGRLATPPSNEDYGEYVVGEKFLDTSEAQRITQITGDSKTVDISHLYGKAGLVFIDGGHTYDVCKADTKQAFKLVRPGGVIVWDDYADSWPDVKRVIDETANKDIYALEFCMAVYKQ